MYNYMLFEIFWFTLNIHLSSLSGLVVGDEILVVSGKVVSELDMMYIENILVEAASICMTIRSCRTERPVNTTPLMEHADVYIDNMVCPPPPSQNRISDKIIDELIIPAPNWGKFVWCGYIHYVQMKLYYY